jgi:hypothetical protein
VEVDIEAVDTAEAGRRAVETVVDRVVIDSR